jgi:hypothetical protein
MFLGNSSASTLEICFPYEACSLARELIDSRDVYFFLRQFRKQPGEIEEALSRLGLNAHYDIHLCAFLPC